jgi:hypothetical protein
MYPRVKLLRSEADHSSPSVVEVKNKWSYTTTTPYAFMACTGITLNFSTFHCPEMKGKGNIFA